MNRLPKTVKVLHWLDIALFPGNFIFSCGFSYEELCELLNKKKAVKWREAIQLFEKSLKYEYCWGFTFSKNIDGEIHNGIIINKQFTFSDEDYTKLAHEVVHLCQFHLPTYLDRDREVEAEAYTHSDIMKKCLQALRG